MKTKPTIVKQQALRTSKLLRANKFKRVSQDFLEQVEADLDAYLRKLLLEIKTADEPLPPVGLLVTPETRDRLLDIVNAKVAALIQNRVKAHPSMGQTLKG